MIRVGVVDDEALVRGELHATSSPARSALPLPSARHGLAGLRRRAELLGGTVTSGPTADGGYELLLELPTGDPS